MEMSQQALKVNETLGDKGFEVSVYNNLGNIHSDMKQYEKSLEAYGKFLQLSQELGQKDGEVIGLVNRGLVFREQRLYDKALLDLEQALEIAQQQEFTYFEAVILNNLGLTSRDAGQIIKAADYFRNSSKLAGSDNIMTLSSSLNGLAGIYLVNNALDSALALANRALDLAQQVGSLEQERDAWKTLSQAYDSTKSYQKALEAHRNFVSLRDSILSEENKSELTRKDLQFEMDLKQAVSDAEIQRQKEFRNVAIVGAILLLLGSVLGYFLYKRRRDALELKKEAEFQKDVAQNQLKVLRAQMNPHFVFNSLNSISDFLHNHDVALANEYLIKFSDLMRMTLEHSEKEFVSLAEDLEWLELYLQLEVQRLDQKFDYSITVDQNVDPENTLVPPMILQPFVENSIWHGISSKKEGHVAINSSIHENMLLYSVDDDGVGRKRSASTKKSHQRSFGIRITENRINILNSLKGTKASLELLDKEEGLKVKVWLPLELLY